MTTQEINNQNSSIQHVVPKGELTFDDKVIQKIVGYAIENVTGLLGANGGFVANIKNKIINSDNAADGIGVEVGKEQVAVDLNVVMEYGYNAHDIYKQLTEVITKKVYETTSLTLVELNVEVVDIQSQKEFEASQTTLQDWLTDAGNTLKEKTSDSVETVKKTADKISDDSDRVK